MSSFQSLIESGDCGATNPVVDLAHQFTQSATDPVMHDLASNGALHQSNGQAPIGPSAAHHIMQSNHQSANPFDMQALLDSMKQMDDLFDKSLNEDGATKQGDPLIGNPSSGLEEEYWTEALLQSTPEFSSLFSPETTANISGGNNWADEYFRTLSEDPSASLEQNEEINKESDLTSYRNQPMNDLDSFFSVDSPFASSNFFKSPPLNVGAAASNIATMPAESFNLKDLVSDQEERLMNMLLSNSGGQQEDNGTTDAAAPPLSDEQIDQMLSTKEEAVDESTVQPSDFKIPESLLTEPEPSQEKFFYEQQFDDMEFWMKLAEDWESSNETDLANLTRVDKAVRIYEPLEELLKPEHVYHYRFVEDNPFLKQQQEESKESTLAVNDYIEQGLAKLEVGDIPAAILYFEAAAKTEPDSVRAWNLLGSAHAKNENDRKAIAATKRCIALEPTNREALMCLSISYANESMPNEACHALKEWLHSHEKYRELVLEAEAVNLNEPSTEEPYMGPTPLSKRWGAGAATGNIFNNGFFDTVKDAYINAAQLSPSEPDADVQCGLGVLFNLSGEYEKAADCFRTAVNVRQSDHTLWNRLGATLANGGNSEEAMSAYREALVRYPGYIRARYNLGISCVLLGADREAIDHLLGVLNQQTAGSKSVQSAGDSILQELLAQPNQITSANVWNTLRSVLIKLGRNDLCDAVDKRDLDRLNGEFSFKLQEETEASDA